MTSMRVMAVCALLWPALIWPAGADDQPGGAAGDAAAGAERAAVTVTLLPVELPLSGDADQQLIAAATAAVAQLEGGQRRGVLILEFRPRDGDSLGTTRFERALSLARFLVSEEFLRVRTVAYVPQSLHGHAVLPVLACEQIVIHPDAQFGAAGLGEKTIDDTMVAAYREIAQRRRTLPVPVVLGMLDPRLQVIEAQLVGGGTRYVSGEELDALRGEVEVWKESTLVPPGELLTISGREMRVVFGGASHLVLDRRELADALQIAPESIQENVVVQQAWRAVRIDLQGRLSSRGANQVALSIRDIQRGGQANLICLRIDSPGGPATPALRLVNLLQSLDANAMRSLAFVESEARSVAALVALAADETYARPDAVLGGPGDTVLPRDTLDAIRLPIEEMAGAKNRDWSLLLGLVDPELPVFRYTREGTGATRYLCAAEHAALPESDQWKRGPQLDLAAGLTAQQAVQFGLIAGLADTVEAALSHLHVEDDVELRQPNSFVSAIERLATQPWFARTLLFIAFFALIGEASTPGIGVSGFVSGICFLLFFWCQFFNGTAGWLEILLFAGGLACIAMEIFVLPGFGIFGIGGGIMVLLSIVLASQTFILPRNSYQFEQLPHSVWTVVMACAGVMSAVWFLRRLLAESWLARKLTLVPPSEELDLDRAESLVDWRHLQGKQGLTTTQLTPSGKAQFGDDVIAVISDGLWIPRATRVRVVEVHGNRVVVEPVEEA